MTEYFPVMYVPMPLDENGDGPADAADTVSVAHEVWGAETNVTICTAKDEATANLIVAAWNLRTQAPDSWRPDREDATITRLESELSAARAGLEPFSRVASTISEVWTEETVAFSGPGMNLSVGDFRRARQAAITGGE